MDQIVFAARKQTGAAIVVALGGVGAVSFLWWARAITPVIACIMLAIVVLIVLGAVAASHRKIVFAGDIFQVTSGEKALRELDLGQVTRLVRRSLIRSKASRVTFLAVLADKEVELFDLKQFPDEPKIGELLEVGSGRRFEVWRT
jgi:hypothetical protein